MNSVQQIDELVKEYLLVRVRFGFVHNFSHFILYFFFNYLNYFTISIFFTHSSGASLKLFASLNKNVEAIETKDFKSLFFLELNSFFFLFFWRDIYSIISFNFKF